MSYTQSTLYRALVTEQDLRLLKEQSQSSVSESDSGRDDDTSDTDSIFSLFDKEDTRSEQTSATSVNIHGFDDEFEDDLEDFEEDFDDMDDFEYFEDDYEFEDFTMRPSLQPQLQRQRHLQQFQPPEPFSMENEEYERYLSEEYIGYILSQELDSYGGRVPYPRSSSLSEDVPEEEPTRIQINYNIVPQNTTPQMRLQELACKQVQTRVKDGAYFGGRFKSGPNRNVFEILETGPQEVNMPYNSAFISSSKIQSCSKRYSLPNKIRYMAGEDYELSHRNLFLERPFIECLTYDTEYIYVETSSTSEYLSKDEREQRVVLRTTGMCPYCPTAQFWATSDDSYKDHLFYEHGVLSDSYVVPDPFQDPFSESTAICPVCSESFAVAIDGTPFYFYLKHFEERHQRFTSESLPYSWYRHFDVQISS